MQPTQHSAPEGSDSQEGGISPTEGYPKEQEI